MSWDCIVDYSKNLKIKENLESQGYNVQLFGDVFKINPYKQNIEYETNSNNYISTFHNHTPSF